MTTSPGAETPAPGAGRSNMPSSVIRTYQYDPRERELELQFVSGRRYRYHEVPEEVWRELRHAFSKGEFFNEHIRDQFRFTRES